LADGDQQCREDAADCEPDGEVPEQEPRHRSVTTVPEAPHGHPPGMRRDDRQHHRDHHRDPCEPFGHPPSNSGRVDVGGATGIGRRDAEHEDETSANRDGVQPRLGAPDQHAADHRDQPTTTAI
jgi:hypothetical protein